MRVLRALLVLVLAVFGLAGATAYPLTVKDALGRTVVLAHAPKRIIALLPSHTETVFALGAGNLLVGRDAYSDYPPAVKNVPVMGDLYNPSLEQILAAKPDLVLNSRYGNLTPALEKAGVPVWAGGALTLDEVYSTISEIGRLIDREPQAAKLVNTMRAQVRDLTVAVKLAKPVSVYYEIDPTPYSVGPNSYLGTLLALAGGRTIVPASLGDFPKINPELVVAADPQVIIGASRENIAARAGWTGLTAVKQGRVYLLTPEQDNLISRAGPRLPQALRTLVKLLHPELLK
ncbi:MAG TPA: ABC transporter substrate-binding protein [Deinococcales bacterium]|nr:ABC transporter substrate-binding protein [Deinococcales bacterium]